MSTARTTPAQKPRGLTLSKTFPLVAVCIVILVYGFRRLYHTLRRASPASRFLEIAFALTASIRLSLQWRERKTTTSGSNYSLIFVNAPESILEMAKRGRKEAERMCNTR